MSASIGSSSSNTVVVNSSNSSRITVVAIKIITMTVMPLLVYNFCYIIINSNSIINSVFFFESTTLIYKINSNGGKTENPTNF